MRITTVSVRDFKRIQDIKITPAADLALVLIGGANGAGKSSTLDALTAAFGGKRAQPTDPVRHGAESAQIVVELDGGLTIKRIIDASGESVLEVRDQFGAVKSPQAVLDKIVSGRFLDPLAFLQLPAKEQRATLMRLIDGADRIANLNERRQRAFDKRTEVGRDLTKAEGELARLPEVKLESPIDVAAIASERDGWAVKEHAGDLLLRTLRDKESQAKQAREILDATRAEIAKVEARLAELRKAEVRDVERIGETDEAVTVASKNFDENAKAQSAGRERREQLDAELARADAHNRAVFAAEAQAKRRTEAEAEVAKLSKERDDITAVLETIDARKAEILSAAKLPVAGLSVADDGIELNGVPFVQASGAERLRVALGLAMAAAPELGDVWIRDGALLDDESLELVAKQAEAAGKRVWIERVGTRDPGVIVIQDGKVAAS